MNLIEDYTKLDPSGVEIALTLFPEQIKTTFEQAINTDIPKMEFNAVLIYYDVFDQNNPADTSTNLYGILFLNKPEQSGINFKIPTLMKYRPDPINNTNGTSYAFKANFKFDTSIDTVFIEKSINDYSTFSLDLYTDVLTQFKDLTRIYGDNISEIVNIKNEITEATGSGFKDVKVNHASQ